MFQIHQLDAVKLRESAVMSDLGSNIVAPLDRIRTADDITRFIAGQPSTISILRLAETLGLPHCWIGVGFVRT
jgi:hypothetical protein